MQTVMQKDTGAGLEGFLVKFGAIEAIKILMMVINTEYLKMHL